MEDGEDIVCGRCATVSSWPTANEELAGGGLMVAGDGLGRVLAAARRYGGWTQAASALASGVDRSGLARMEAGGADPRASTVQRVVDALGLRTVLVPIWRGGPDRTIEATVDGSLVWAPGHSAPYALEVDAGWVAWMRARPECRLEEPDPRGQPFRRYTGWAQPYRDARQRRLRWIAARRESLQRVRERIRRHEEELDAEARRLGAR